MNTNTQVFFDDCSAFGALLTRVFGINFHDLLTSLFRFVRKETYKLIPGDILDTSIQRTISALLHLSNLKVFDTKHIITVYKSFGLLVGKVFSLGGDSLMYSCYCFLVLVLFLLSFGKSLLFLFEKARIVYDGVIRHHCKSLASEIDTDYIQARARQQPFLGRMLSVVNRKNSVPFPCWSPLNCACLSLAQDETMRPRFDTTDFGKFQRSICPPFGQSEPELRIAKGVVSIPTLKPGISRFFTFLNSTKEGTKCPINSVLNVLKDLRVHARKSGSFFFPNRKEFTCSSKRQRLLLFFPSLLANFECFVVNKTTGIKRLQELFLLAGGRIESKGEVPFHYCPSHHVVYSRQRSDFVRFHPMTEVMGILAHSSKTRDTKRGPPKWSSFGWGPGGSPYLFPHVADQSLTCSCAPRGTLRDEPCG